MKTIDDVSMTPREVIDVLGRFVIRGLSMANTSIVIPNGIDEDQNRERIERAADFLYHGFSEDERIVIEYHNKSMASLDLGRKYMLNSLANLDSQLDRVENQNN